MPARVLETPSGSGLDWDELYTYRGEEVDKSRPYITGDVFHDVAITNDAGSEERADVMLLQHPCALRKNGIDFVTRVPVARISSLQLLKNWTGNYKRMPLPGLFPDRDTPSCHCAASFEQLELVSEGQLADRRVACLTQYGVALLLQRWVHHNSRVIVPTHTLERIICGPFAEADLVEEWCFRMLPDGSTSEAIRNETIDCTDWLGGDYGGETRQKALAHKQKRAAIQKHMVREISSRRAKLQEGGS